MSSAGNDIVALKAIDKQRTNHIRFYSKILSDAEHSLYDGQLPAEMPFENFVWLLWSVKESIYKYLKRTTPTLVFSPTKIVVCSIEAPCRVAVPRSRSSDFRSVIERGDPWERRMTGPVEEFYRGIAFFGSQTFYFRSKVYPEFIATVVNAEENFENIWWGVERIGHPSYAHQSASVRVFALDKLKEVLADGKNKEDLRIGKSPLGHPIVLKGEEEMKIPISLAHHDHFIAYSFLLVSPFLQG